MPNKFSRFGPRKPTPEMELKRAYESAQKKGKSPTRRLVGRKVPGVYVTRAHPFNNSVQRMERIVLDLQRKGIMIPRIAAIEKRGEDPSNLKTGSVEQMLRAISEMGGYIAFQKGGVSLAKRFGKQWGENGPDRQQQRQAARIFSKVARHIALLHRQEIEHGHPHFGNIILRGNRVGSIDYKHAQKRRVDWNSLASVISSFSGDYFHLRRKFHQFRIDYPDSAPFFIAQERKLIGKIVSRYPMAQKKKEKLVDWILSKDFWELHK